MGEPVKTTTVRFPPWLHKLIWARAYEEGTSFNQLVVDACVRAYVDEEAPVNPGRNLGKPRNYRE